MAEEPLGEDALAWEWENEAPEEEDGEDSSGDEEDEDENVSEDEDAGTLLLALQESRRREKRRHRRRPSRYGGPHGLLYCPIAILFTAILFHHFELRYTGSGRERQGHERSSPTTSEIVGTDTTSSWEPGFLKEFRERDEALQRVGNSWYTATFTPEYYQSMAQWRMAPYQVLLGIATTAAQMTGHGYVATSLVLAGLATTGRTPPNLWTTSSFSSGGVQQNHFPGSPLNSGPPAAAYHAASNDGSSRRRRPGGNAQWECVGWW